MGRATPETVELKTTKNHVGEIDRGILAATRARKGDRSN